MAEDAVDDSSATGIGSTASSLPSSSPSSSALFPYCGVKISYVVGEFIEQVVGGEDNLKGMTTEDVCKNIIMPHTLSFSKSENNNNKSSASYCDMLQSQNHPAYGEKAEAFVSHAHSYMFLDFISSLKWLLRDEPDTIVWIDLFSINQHRPTDWTFDWLSTTFKSAVQNMGRTIMVMHPWSSPKPFTRSWCVFEAYCTAVTESKFEIAMSKSDESNFLQHMRTYPDDIMNEVLVRINAEKSQCSVESDKISIFTAIRKTVGFSKLDAMVFERYREWSIQVCLEALQTIKEDQKKVQDRSFSMIEGETTTIEHMQLSIKEAEMLNAVGRLYSRMGKYDNAEIYTRQSMESYTKIWGEKDPSTLSSLNNVARVLYVQGKYEEARIVFESCYDQRKEVLGEDHPDTLITMSKLALTYVSLGQYDNAQTQFESCLNKRLTIMGPDHPSTLKTMHHLATVLYNQGKYEEAEILCHDTYERSKSVLGEDHPDTIRTVNGLASALGKLGKFQQAQILLEKCLERRKAIAGEDHPFTLHSMYRLATILASQGREAKKLRNQARDLFESCLELRTSTLGDNHPDTLSTIHGLALLLCGGDGGDDDAISSSGSQGQEQQYTQNHHRALKLFETCLDRRKIVLGSDHPDTLSTMYWLANVLERNGYHDKALALYEPCLEKQMIVLGADHPDTLKTIATMEGRATSERRD